MWVYADTKIHHNSKPCAYTTLHPIYLIVRAPHTHALQMLLLRQQGDVCESEFEIKLLFLVQELDLIVAECV